MPLTPDQMNTITKRLQDKGVHRCVACGFNGELLLDDPCDLLASSATTFPPPWCPWSARTAGTL